MATLENFDPRTLALDFSGISNIGINRRNEALANRKLALAEQLQRANLDVAEREILLKEQKRLDEIEAQESIQSVLQGIPGLGGPQPAGQDGTTPTGAPRVVPGDLDITAGGDIGVSGPSLKPVTQSVLDTEKQIFSKLIPLKGGLKIFNEISPFLKRASAAELATAKKKIIEKQGFALKVDRAKTRADKNRLIDREQARLIQKTGRIDPDLQEMRNMSDDDLQGEILSDLAIGPSLTKAVDNRLVPPVVKGQTDIGKAQQDLTAGIITKEDFNKLKNVPPEFKSKVGKLMGDKKAALDVFGKNSPQVKAFDEVIKAEIKGGPKLSDVKGVRGDFIKLSGDFQKIGSAFKKVNSSKATAAGDLSLIFNFMKILDPTSVVREGEFATAASAGPLIDAKTLGLYNRIVSGERLLPSQRTDFKATAQEVFSSQIGDQLTREQEFTDIAKRAGMNPKDVVLDFIGPFREIGGDKKIGAFTIKKVR